MYPIGWPTCFGGILAMLAACPSCSTRTSAPEVAICDDVTLRCDLYNPSRSPPPYDGCDGFPYYHVCPGGPCLPVDGDLAAFYRGWLIVAPELLGTDGGTIERHVFVNAVKEEPTFGDGLRRFSVIFLVVVDWAVVRMNHGMELPEETPLTPETAATKLREFNLSWARTGIPAAIVARDRVQSLLDKCSPLLVPNYCGMLLGRAPDAPRETVIINASEPYLGTSPCFYGSFDLARGEVLSCTEIECSN